eukprot:CAMPEP_0180062856 /NCGR_PEP_ID=MMETSP0985-20121206/7329_1 /TAXON_ID=483367 /ORGANISM="non described non described, Strain CCMP 2436" /LENGTH=432 /DNA_ID=CAMNT_0021993035 /DNA_START=266 /DNA_END=1560 /DNA_ORIENTATION=+
MTHLSAHAPVELECCERIPARECTEVEALLAHSKSHWDCLLGLPATQLRAAHMASNEHTAESSRLAAGSVIALVDRVCSGELTSGFALVRPPGHHAGHSTMQGFCFLNNIAIAARVARARYKLERVLVLDWDVHHGNGTQALLADEPGIMYISLHRKTKDFYPRTGEATEVGHGAGAGFTLNVPWRRTGMGNEQYKRAFEEVIMPVAQQFEPQLVLVSAGYDASHGDPLGGMQLTPSAYAFMVRQLQKLAGGKIVCVLEGGYRLKSTATGVAATLRALASPLGETVHLESDPFASECDEKARRLVEESCSQTINEVCKVHRQHWGVLHQREIAKRLGPADSKGDDDARSGAPSVRSRAASDGRTDRAAGAPLQASSTPSSTRPPHSTSSAQPPIDTCARCGELREKLEFAKSMWRRAASSRRVCVRCTQGAG